MADHWLFLFLSTISSSSRSGGWRHQSRHNHPNLTYSSSYLVQLQVTHDKGTMANFRCRQQLWHSDGQNLKRCPLRKAGWRNPWDIPPPSSRSWHGISLIDRRSTHLWCVCFVVAHSHQEDRQQAVWKEAMQIRHEKIVQSFFFSYWGGISFKLTLVQQDKISSNLTVTWPAKDDCLHSQNVVHNSQWKQHGGQVSLLVASLCQCHQVNWITPITCWCSAEWAGEDIVKCETGLQRGDLT